MHKKSSKIQQAFMNKKIVLQQTTKNGNFKILTIGTYKKL